MKPIAYKCLLSGLALASLLALTGCNVPIVPIVKEDAPVLPHPVERESTSTSTSAS